MSCGIASGRSSTRSRSADLDATSGSLCAVTATFRDRVATRILGVTHDIEALTEGFWAVVLTFEGELTAIRYAECSPVSGSRAVLPPVPGAWPGVIGPWRSSLDEAAYVRACRIVRDRVAAGTVYQVNICRVVEAEVPAHALVSDLAAVLARGNPAPYAACID